MARKKAIVIEDRLKEIFSYLPALDGYTPVFKTGDQKELLSFFAQSQSNSNYPLIWLEMPYQEDHRNRTKVVVDGLNLILAVQSTNELLNSERMELTYKKYLYPLLNNVLDAFEVGNTTTFDRTFSITKFSNYSDQQTIDQGVAPDIWDAIKLTLDVEFNDSCLREIKI